MSKLEDALSAALIKRKQVLSQPPEAILSEYAKEDPEGPDTPGASSQAAHMGPFHAIPDEIKNDPQYLMGSEQNRMAAEQFGILKETLIRSTNGTDFKNTIMVTSSFGGEGKTVISINLAISLAKELDHTVLLVDADLRKPSISEYLCMEQLPGLTECLSGEIALGEALTRTDISKLSILPSGRPAENPAELFSSKVMADLVAEIKHRYPDRYIIIDTPPVIPFAETRTMGHCVDNVIYVVKEGASSLQIVERGLKALKGASILGLVFNQATDAGLPSHVGLSSYY